MRLFPSTLVKRYPQHLENHVFCRTTLLSGWPFLPSATIRLIYKYIVNLTLSINVCRLNLKCSATPKDEPGVRRAATWQCRLYEVRDVEIRGIEAQGAETQCIWASGLCAYPRLCTKPRLCTLQRLCTWPRPFAPILAIGDEPPDPCATGQKKPLKIMRKKEKRTCHSRKNASTERAPLDGADKIALLLYVEHLMLHRSPFHHAPIPITSVYTPRDSGSLHFVPLSIDSTGHPPVETTFSLADVADRALNRDSRKRNLP